MHQNYFSFSTNLFLLLFSLNFSGFAQVVTFEHEYAIGGFNTFRHNVPLNIIELKSGGFLTYSRHRNSLETSTLALQKLDVYGNALWTKFYSMSTPDDEDPIGIKETSDHGFVTAFKSYNSFDPDTSPIIIVKFDSAGDLQWNKYVGGNSDHYYANVSDIDVGADSSIFVLGDSAIANASIGFIKKYDLNGVLMWSRNISTAYPYLFIARDNVLSVLLENKPGADTLYLYKYAMINGDSLFSKAIIANHLPDTAISLVDFSIGLYDSYYICYNQQPSHSASGYFYNFKIVKSDFLGNIEWQKYFVDTVNFTQANAATSTSDSGYAILRTQNNSCTPYSPKCILLKLNGDGDSISQTCFGNPFYLNSRFSDIIETSSNLLASIAYGDSDIMYFNSLDHFISVIVCDSLGNYPSWLIEEDPINNAYIFPNPFTDYIKINYPISVNQATKIDLYDSIGRNLLTKIIEENNQSIDLSFIDNGFYLLTIHYQDRIRSLKIVKVVR